MRVISLMIAGILLVACGGSPDKINSPEAMQEWTHDFMERWGTSMDKAVTENDVEELENLYVSHVCECYSLVSLDHTRELLDNFTKASLKRGKVDENALGIILTENYNVKMYRFCKSWEDGYSGLTPTDEEKAVLVQRVEAGCGSDKKEVLDGIAEAIKDFREQMIEAGIWEETAQ